MAVGKEPLLPERFRLLERPRRSGSGCAADREGKKRYESCCGERGADDGAQRRDEGAVMTDSVDEVADAFLKEVLRLRALHNPIEIFY
eukprot:scaffold731_cov261-Pinguiococcus_pyrenoidosus.AAC.77